jgi:type I restriction enzyme, S subunit
VSGSTAKYKPYPAYKPSGVEWLGGIPDHWACVAVRRVARRVKTGGTPQGVSEEAFTQDGFPWYTPGDFGVGLFLDKSLRELSPTGRGQVPVFPPDTVMMVGIGSLGKVGVTRVEAGCNQQVNAIEVNRLMLPSFLARHLLGLGEYLLRCGKFTTLPIINQDETRSLPVPLPPLPEQRAIAGFLDRETGRIDALIEKKRRLIELLVEKRSALISHAVTKGLDPDAPMKDSGIDWLGQIPAHWEVKKLGFLSRIGNGSTPSRENSLYWDDGDYPWLNSGVVNHSPVKAAEQFVTPLALHECHLPVVPPHSVLVGITGQGRTRGMSAVLTYEATINQHVAYITPHMDAATAAFLCWELTAAYPILRDISDGAGSTKGALTCEQLGQFRLAVPPLPEQAHIAGQLSSESAKLGALVSKNREAIDKLQEYRTALISAAVTGKIDVREART